MNLPRSGWPTKFTPKQHRGGEKEARTTSKQLQALPVSLKVRVHDTTIRKGLGKNDIYGEKIKMKTIADQKELKDSSHICQKNYLDEFKPCPDNVHEPCSKRLFECPVSLGK